MLTLEQKEIKLGLQENWQQFSWLVLVTGFVGGMVGIERTLLPQLAEEEFHIASTSAVLSFIVAFGITKALTNYFTGALANKLGRRKLLIIGWLIGLPIPWILMYATSWNLIIVANILLGLNQGLTWSSTVVMKIDLVGEKNRGLAMGLNEFAGYLAVGLVALLTGYLASRYGLRPYPFLIGVVFSVLGLLISTFIIKDTAHHVAVAETASDDKLRLRHVFRDTTLFNRNLSSITQAGLVNNLNDGMVWGLLPVLLSNRGFSLTEVGLVTAVYPGVWGFGQLFTGRLSDFVSRKVLLFWGMLLQGITLLLLAGAAALNQFIILAAFLGLGTALVYPTFLVAISENTNPGQRAESLGVFRLWRDMGYAVGALITGFLAEYYGLLSPLFFIGGLTLLSAMVIKFRMVSGRSSAN
ncbi:MFS transporter [Adhaeribacter aerolatus]|uniref:MFS transporter n=1 Tax=Adhaeribacter aerolatus TaxID=670289 RepID=A0A512AWA4_9BACT|nr:MFS transporter [Adhaeribacter aerolatus]GEO04002.1 MFS transporter [Adhaeribacter aerolatus]